MSLFRTFHSQCVVLKRWACGVGLLATIALGGGHASQAGEAAPMLSSQPLTLQKAITYGLDHNRTLKAARQEARAVREQVRQTKADFYPKLDASYTFRHLSDQPYARFNMMGSEEEIPTSHSTTNRWQVDLTQPVFTGFGLTAKLNISKMDYRIAEYRVDETRLNVVRDIQYAFFQSLLGEKLLQVARDNVHSLEVHRQNAEAQYQQGLTAQNDVLKAEVALAQAQQQERSVAKQLIILHSRLNQLLDLDLKAQLNLSEEDISLRAAPALDQLYAMAEKQRPEYQILTTSIQQAEEGVTAAKSKYYPHVSLFGQYYREGEDFLARYNDYTNEQNAAVGVRVDWNWFEGGKTDAAIKEWRYRQAALKEKQGDLSQQIRIQVEDAYEQLKVASANLDTAKAALKQAQENERMTSLQYKEQLVIFLEVLNAQISVAQSSADYYQALFGYQLAWADLERAIGGAIN